MKNTQRILVGLCVVFIVFIISLLSGNRINLETAFSPYSFVPHSLMLVGAILLIYIFKKEVSYKIALPPFKKIVKPIIIAFGITIALHISNGVLIKLLNLNTSMHPAFAKMNAWQVLVFVFIYASIAEELLFRGFFLNFLNPLKNKGVKLFNTMISLPVIISALAFGCSHLILARTEVGVPFLVYVVIFTTVLGIIAGYYQEKYNNNAFAIIVHMTGNLPAVIMAFIMALK